MLSDRKRLYEKNVIDGNKEIDLLQSVIPNMRFDENYTRSIIVSSDMLGRLDLISNYFYNTTEFWWLIAQYNNIINPIEDMKIGQLIKIPSMIEFYNIYNRNAKLDTIDQIFTTRKIT